MTTPPAPVASRFDDAVTALAWATDGGHLWAGTADGTVARIDRRGSATGRSGPRRARIVALAVDPTSNTVASADAAGLVVLEGDHGEIDLLSLGSRPRTVAWSATDGRLALTSQAAGVLVVDRRATRRFALPPSRRHRRAAWHDDGPSRHLVVFGAGATTWVGPTDPTTGLETVTTTPSPEVTVAAASAPGGWLAKGDLRGQVTILDTARGTAMDLAGWPDPVERLAWIGGAEHLAVVGGDEVTAWPTSDLGDGAEPASPARTSPDGSPVLHLAAHPWRSEIALATEGGTVEIWAPTNRRRVEVWSSPVAAVSSLAWDPLGERLAIGLRDGDLRIAVPPAAASGA